MSLPPFLRAVSLLLAVVGVTMLTTVPVSLLCHDPDGTPLKLFLCSICPLAAAALLRSCSASKGKELAFGVREGFGVVTIGWTVATLFSSLPYIIVCSMYPWDAFFETMSGYTTTGSSVIDGILPLMDGTHFKTGLADIPRGVLYWRSMTNWLGGMGIVMLTLAILPSLGMSSHQLFNAEASGPVNERIAPRIASTAKILWGVYVLCTIVQTVLLMFAGLSFFDSWCTTCGSIATGGLSNEQASIGAYHNAWVDWIVVLFMFIGGANFVLHYKALKGDRLIHFKDEEFRAYLLIVIFASVTVAWSILGGRIVISDGSVIENANWLDALRHGTFQVVSIITTTGFVTADFNLWPAYACVLLVVLMFVGGCGGSTSGSVKVSRILILGKSSMTYLHRCLYPRCVLMTKINGQTVPESTVTKTLGFFFMFCMVFVGTTLLLCVLGVQDVVTAATASIASLGNIGPGLGKVGAIETYSWMSPAAKILLSFAMLVGRLEVYTFFVLFLPSFWRR